MINAKPRVAAGASVHANAGDTFAPSQLYFVGMSPSASNDALANFRTGPVSFCCASCPRAAKQSNKHHAVSPPTPHFAIILRSRIFNVPPRGQYGRFKSHRTLLTDNPPSLTITAF